MADDPRPDLDEDIDHDGFGQQIRRDPEAQRTFGVASVRVHAGSLPPEGGASGCPSCHLWIVEVTPLDVAVLEPDVGALGDVAIEMRAEMWFVESSHDAPVLRGLLIVPVGEEHIGDQLTVRVRRCKKRSLDER